MKILSKIFLISSALASSSIGASATPTLGISYIRISPLYLSSKSTLIELSVTGTTKIKTTIDVKIINDIYPSGKLIFNKTYSAAASEKINYNNEYTRPSGNSISVTVTVNGVKNEYKHEVNVSKGKMISINAPNYSYTADSMYYRWESSTKRWTTNYEKITFYNFEDIYVPDYYHKIDINHFYIKVNSSFDTAYLGYGDLLFKITNKDGIFDCFDHDETNAYFPLTFRKMGTNFKLYFDCDLYVNPSTLEMSSEEKDGFIKTQFLYLPKNEQRFEETYDCAISLSYLSQDSLKLVSHFKYKSLLNTFGDCRSSEYCIVKS